MENCRKYFKEFTTSQLFTKNIYELMQQKKNIMLLIDDNIILIDGEIDNYYKYNNLLDTTKRIIYKYVRNKGYAINYSHHATTITVSFNLLENNYINFIKKVS